MDYMIERAPTAEDFLQHTESFRNAHPMETNILGSVATSVAKGTKSYSECFWWVVLQRDEVVGIAMRTAPYRLLLSPMPLNAIRELSLAVLERDTGFWGVTGPEECATEFIGCWCEQTDRQKSDYPQHMRETLYVLGEHTPHPKVEGKARKASDEDIPLLSKWIPAFAQEVGIFHAKSSETELREALLATTYLIWEEEGRPVALSGHGPVVVSSEGRTGRIGPVYTEPIERGHGYGAAVTSSMIKHLESIGCTTIMLYADSDYEKSNRVYRRLGFEPVGAMVELGVDPPASVQP
jgi:predicted GNAT family acetyltransferase